MLVPKKLRLVIIKIPQTNNLLGGCLSFPSNRKIQKPII